MVYLAQATDDGCGQDQGWNSVYSSNKIDKIGYPIRVRVRIRLIRLDIRHLIRLGLGFGLGLG